MLDHPLVLTFSAIRPQLLWALHPTAHAPPKTRRIHSPSSVRLAALNKSRQVGKQTSCTKSIWLVFRPALSMMILSINRRCWSIKFSSANLSQDLKHQQKMLKYQIQLCQLESRATQLGGFTPPPTPSLDGLGLSTPSLDSHSPFTSSLDIDSLGPFSPYTTDSAQLWSPFDHQFLPYC